MPVSRSGVRFGEYTAPKGVSIRFPPAKGLVGSAVWQLAQSPASTSALPCSTASSEGSAGKARAPNAPHKNKQAKIVRLDITLPCTLRVAALQGCYVVSRAPVARDTS